MMKLTPLMATLSLLALGSIAAGCATPADVRFDADPAADFSQYKTFAFFDPVGAEKSAYATLISSRLKQATRQQLERQHYVYSEDQPDLRVNLMLGVVERQDVHSVPGGTGRFGYRGWTSGIETTNYRQGTLVIDLVDAKRQALVWRGVAEGRLDVKAMNNPGHVIDEVVGEVFARLATRPAARQSAALTPQ